MEKPDNSDTKKKELMPLHRRRFDAKQKLSPPSLSTLPTESPKKFCEDLIVKLNKKDDQVIEELQPLYTRTANTAIAAINTEDAFDHIDKLYRLMDQLLTLKDQNSKIQRRVKDIEHIKKLQEMHHQIEKEMLKTKSDTFLIDEATSMDLDEEYEYTEALLDSMLAAGRNASLKRAKWKSPSRSKLRQSVVRKERSRSMGGEELEACPLPDKDYSQHLDVPYKGRSSRSRRGSDSKTSGDKAKISKWTRVKAAFKWEKAHTGISGDSPAVMLRSTIPLATSSAALTSSATPAITPASISPASSVEEVSENGMCRREYDL